MGRYTDECWTDAKDKEKKADSLPEKEKEKLEQQRLVDIFNWVWQPEKENGKQVEWDAMDFVVRLLKRPGGIVFMGGAYYLLLPCSFFSSLLLLVPYPSGFLSLALLGSWDTEA